MAIKELVTAKQREFNNLAEQYEKKWEPLLGENLKGYNRSVTAILLENQLEYIDRNRGMLTEASVSGDVAGPERVLLPIVRRFYPALVANKLVGIQPMTTPSSLVFYLRYYYTFNKGKTVAGDEFIGVPGSPGPYAGWAYDPYYSSTEVELDVDINTYAGGTTHTGAIATADISKNLTWLNQLGSGNVVTSNGWGAYVTSQSDAGSASSTGEVDHRVEITSIAINKTTGSVDLTFESELSQNSDNSYPDDLTIFVYGDFEFREELPEVDLRILSESVTARTRKLKTKWSNEAEQDMKIIHNIDAEKELIALLSNEIALEIDREILRDLLMQSFLKEVYNFKSISQQFDYMNPSKGIADRIVQLANKIYKYTKLGVGNWIVTSPEVAAKLETIQGFEPANMDGTDNTTNEQFGISFCGKLNKRISVYKDAIFPASKVLLGYKGENFMQSGYFYCPYVPVQMTPTIIDPEDFTPRKGLMTRYGKILVDGGQYSYGQLTVTNLV